jgi:hypothetical protein
VTVPFVVGALPSKSVVCPVVVVDTESVATVERLGFLNVYSNANDGRSSLLFSVNVYVILFVSVWLSDLTFAIFVPERTFHGGQIVLPSTL